MSKITLSDRESVLFALAHDIAYSHVENGWFESWSSVIVRRIKLRTDVYEALKLVDKESK